jgi:flagellar basal-body rod protein FlgF
VNSGIYTAYSGMQAQLEALDLISNNLSNLNTAGYKEQTAFFTVLSRYTDSSGNPGDLNAVINSQSILADSLLNIEDGSISLTHRDLDVALTGNGFMAVQTPNGTRYTRNGSLIRNAQSILSTADGFPVMSTGGKAISLGPGSVIINESGEIFLNDARVDRMKIVTFDNPSMLVREGRSLLAPRDGQAIEKAADARVNQGYLEQSNVSAVSSVVRMVGVMRQFEAIQKSLSLEINDMNSKAIDRLSR